MTIVGSVAVVIAATIVTSLPLKVLTYMVCVVMVICSITFLKDAHGKKETNGGAETSKQADSESVEAQQITTVSEAVQH